MNGMFRKLTGNPDFELKEWILDNIVTIIFWIFIILGFILSDGITVNWFLTELSNRFYRNAFLVLSLIIPVVAGLGLNFGITVGAIAGQLALLFVRYFDMGGMGGFALAMLLSTPIAILIGWLCGVLYNKTRGQEMIASLIVGYFGNGVYMFIVLFVVGAIIPVAAEHTMILPGGVGIRMSVDMGTIHYALEDLLQVGFAPFMAAISGIFCAWTVFRRFFKKLATGEKRMTTFSFLLRFVISLGLCLLFVVEIATEGVLTRVRDVPVFTVATILLLALLTRWIMTTKLGQNFRACGQNQHIAESNGINVNRTRVIATVISTVLAAWGMVLYLQNIGTLNVYTAHSNMGFFSVAAILVGGATASRATVGQAITGCLLFQAMFILSPEIGKSVFGQAALGEYFRTFMLYGVIGVSLGLYVWRAYKKQKLVLPAREEEKKNNG